MGVRDSNGVSKGGKCWFAVESMAFEISIEEVRGKLRGTIWERSKGLSSWIRFGEKGLSLLLEGVEVWCKGESNSRLLKVWDEETRKFRLECRSNVAGRFLLCSVRDVEGKNCENSYQCDSTMGKVESSVNTSENESGSYAEVVKGKRGESGDSLRVHLGEKEMMCKEEQLGHCLVGCFGGSPESIPLLPSLKRWAWDPEVGCTWKESLAKEVWVRVVGLPLHLWMGSDLVKDSGMNWPGSLQVEAGNSRWMLCLWWEAPPRVMQAMPCSWMQMRSEWEVRDEGGGASCTESRPVPSRAPPEIDGSFVELEHELLAVGNVGGMESSLSHLKPTDDALLD
ncbi:hypothetical protein CK203_089253 [Vitis vinifera]|uniref:DUF4283 domain-containing protein n=1 Tax=Vitis vinifera TaxID=29760 RepID=A0A438CZZ5_VITVI|nr:hypothetical protein CK203_089253 [Vitis vinifera]